MVASMLGEDPFDDYIREPNWDRDYRADPLLNHTPVFFIAVLRATAKATLFQFMDKDGYPADVWVPTALLRNRDSKKKMVYIFKPFWTKKRKEANLSVGTGRGTPKKKVVVKPGLLDAAANEALGIYEPMNAGVNHDS